MTRWGLKEETKYCSLCKKREKGNEKKAKAEQRWKTSYKLAPNIEL